MKEKGITLIALIITIIIMLILAAVTFGTINGGLFEFAGKAKTEVEETSTKSAIQEAYIMAKGESKTNRVKESDMQKQIDKQFPDEDASVAEEGDKLIVVIGEKYYEVDNNGKVVGPSKLEPVVSAGDITRGGTRTGTQSNPYKIECIEDLVGFSKAVCSGNNFSNKYVIVTKDLDFNSIFSYSNYRTKYSYSEEQKAYIPDENSTTTIKELCTTGEGFIPIGYGGKQFSGSFNGQNHEIKNIYIKRSGDVALFRSTYQAKIIENLTISGHIVSTNSRAVGLVLYGICGSIRNCINKAKIEGEKSAAGIVYEYSSTPITRCGNEGEIICHAGASGDTRAAGISVTFNASTISKCYNTGKITNEGGGLSGASGICGKSTPNHIQLTNCYNTGDVTSITGTAGGINNWSDSIIRNCFNSGKISGKATSPYGGVARYYLRWWFSLSCDYNQLLLNGSNKL